MDWLVWVLVIVVLASVALGVWRWSGRTPDHVEKGAHRPGSEDQYGRYQTFGG
jgi:hypothetical protein